MSFTKIRSTSSDYLLACVVATEVPPNPIDSPGKPPFTIEMRDKAIRAVIDVIANRVSSDKFPLTEVQVLLQRKAFSGVYLSQVSGEDFWVRAVAGKWFPEHVERCYNVWKDETWEDITGGCTYYFSPISMNPPMSEPDWWANLSEMVIPGLSGEYFRFGREN